jgi:hypothetical protein
VSWRTPTVRTPTAVPEAAADSGHCRSVQCRSQPDSARGGGVRGGQRPSGQHLAALADPPRTLPRCPVRWTPAGVPGQAGAAGGHQRSGGADSGRGWWTLAACRRRAVAAGHGSSSHRGANSQVPPPGRRRGRRRWTLPPGVPVPLVAAIVGAIAAVQSSCRVRIMIPDRLNRCRRLLAPNRASRSAGQNLQQLLTASVAMLAVPRPSRWQLPVRDLHGSGDGQRPPGSVRYDRHPGGGLAHRVLSRHPIPTITSYTTKRDLTQAGRRSGPPGRRPSSR